MKKLLFLLSLLASGLILLSNACIRILPPAPALTIDRVVEDMTQPHQVNLPSSISGYSWYLYPETDNVAPPSGDTTAQTWFIIQRDASTQTGPCVVEIQRATAYSFSSTNLTWKLEGSWLPDWYASATAGQGNYVDIPATPTDSGLQFTVPDNKIIHGATPRWFLSPDTAGVFVVYKSRQVSGTCKVALAAGADWKDSNWGSINQIGSGRWDLLSQAFTYSTMTASILTQEWSINGGSYVLPPGSGLREITGYSDTTMSALRNNPPPLVP